MTVIVTFFFFFLALRPAPCACILDDSLGSCGSWGGYFFSVGRWLIDWMVD